MSDQASAIRAPTVSVVLPTYNRLPLLQEAVASVLQQTFGDWELIVADDGSTDGTADYLSGLGDPRVRGCVLDHRGSPARARAAALRVARGEWIAFLDSDDLWVPNKLELQLACLTDSRVARWGYTGYQLVDLQGAPVQRRQWRPDFPHSGWILERLLTFETSASIPTVVVHRSLLDEVGGIDETIGIRDDYDLAVRLAARSEACAVPDALTLVRDHGGRTTAERRPADLVRDTARVFDKVARTTASRRVRALCIRQRGIQLSELARVLSREGSHREALTAIARALADAPLAIRVWRSAALSVLRLLRLRR
jgi:glycosyltransferase involved in cell wall biosynthesis